MSVFGALLKRHLANAGLSQNEFARRVGVTGPTISGIVSGKHAPRFHRAEDWVRELHLTGAVAETFMDEMALASSPVRVQRLVARLRSR